MSNVRFTANARTLGTRQTDQLKRHSHAPNMYVSYNNSPRSNSATIALGSANYFVIPPEDMAEGGAESRPVNTAYAPRIHA